MLDLIYPDNLSPEELDGYLSEGYFRACNALHKCDIVCTGEDILSPINIRLPLAEHSFSKSNRKLLNRNNKKFRVEYGEPYFNSRINELFSQMKSRFQGFVCDTPKMSLLGETEESVFATKMFSIYDGHKLVACSYFDYGKDTIASIMGLYDNSYMSFGLGKYTMLLEILQAQQEGKEFYYPGYIFSTDNRMDYKLSLGDFEYRSDGNVWKNIGYNKEEKDHKRLDTGDSIWADELIKSKLHKLEQYLRSVGILSRKMIYPLYDIRTLTLEGFENVAQPMIMQASTGHYIEYDSISDNYRIFRGNYANGPLNKSMIENGMYEGPYSYRDNFIGYDKVLFTHQSPEIIAQILLSFVIQMTQVNTTEKLA
jgi:arginine-tRNA-protein transferase